MRIFAGCVRGDEGMESGKLGSIGTGSVRAEIEVFGRLRSMGPRE